MQYWGKTDPTRAIQIRCAHWAPYSGQSAMLVFVYLKRIRCNVTPTLGGIPLLGIGETEFSIERKIASHSTRIALFRCVHQAAKAPGLA